MEAGAAARRFATCPPSASATKPIDGGHYLFSTAERDAFIAKEPVSAKWFRRWLKYEFLNGYERWCLWLGDAARRAARAMPEAMKPCRAVKALREASKSAPTRKLAATPTRFHVENMPTAPYLVLPEGRRNAAFVPFRFEQPGNALCGNLVKIAPHALLLR